MATHLLDWLVIDRLDKRDIEFIIDVLLAGLHTTSYFTAFLLYQLATNRTNQEFVRGEVEKHLTRDEMKTDGSIDKQCMWIQKIWGVILLMN